MSVFDQGNHLRLQEDVIASRVDPDRPLPNLVDEVRCKHYNIFYNKETESVKPVQCKKGQRRIRLASVVQEMTSHSSPI